MTVRLYILLALSITVGCAPMGERLDPRARQTVDAHFAELDEGNRPGAAVVISHRGETFYQGYFGQAQLEYDIPVSGTTPFHAGSIAKQIVGYLVVRLAHAGELDLDARVQDYLADAPSFECPLTLRHLLHHTSGLRDGFDLLAMAGWRRDDVITDHQVRLVLRGQRSLNHPPGAEFSYTNSGYVLLAEIIQEVTGMPLADWAEARVFEPLGMDRSAFVRSHEEIIPGLAYSFGQVDGEWRHERLNSAAAGAGGLITTGRDLVRWLHYLQSLRDGDDPAWKAMVAPGLLASGEEITNARDESYGAGLFIGEYRGLDYVGHGGGIAGYRAAAYLFPDLEIAVALLMNGEWQSAYAIALGLAEIIARSLGVALEAPEDSVQSDEGEPDRELLARAAGFYVVRQPFPGANLPSHIGIVIREQEGRPAVTILGERTEIAQVLSATEFHTRQWSHVHFRLSETDGDSPRVEADFGDGFVTLETGGCPPEAETPDSLAGRYHSAELGTQYYLSAGEDRLNVRHPRLGSGWLLCLAPDIYLAAGVATDRGWGFSKAEVRRDREGNIEGLYLSFGERTRRVLFEKLPDAD